MNIFFADCERSIIVVRYGQSARSNLTSLGHKQIQLTAKRLKELDLSFDALYTSTQSYDIDSAYALRDQLDTEMDVYFDPILNEIKPDESKYKQRMEKAYQKYFTDDSEVEFGGKLLLVLHENIIRSFFLK